MTNFKQTEIGLIPEESGVVMLGKGLRKLLKNGLSYRKEVFGPLEKERHKEVGRKAEEDLTMR